MKIGLKRKLVIAGTILTLVCVATLGNAVGNSAKADETWVNDQLAANNKVIANAGFTKKEELKKNANGDIKASINGKLSPELEKAQSELEKMLEEYYKMKLDGLTDSDEYRFLEQKIYETQNSILDRYKKEIDTIFAGQ